MKCCIITIEDNTEIEYESETSSLSYSFARHLTLALQSYKLHLISPELPKGSSILITDIESESRFAMTSTKAHISQLLDSNEIQQLRDVSVFEINGMKVFM